MGAEPKRVVFDFEVEFSNGGDLRGRDFRLDLDGDSISDGALGEYIVRDLHLLMVKRVHIRRKRIIREQHKRRGGTSMKETIEQYKKRILGYIGTRNALASQRATPEKLARLTRGLTRAQLTRKPAPGKWSIAEVLAHLAESEIVTGYRFRMMLSASGGPIQAFDQDRWAQNARYDRIDPKLSLAAFRAMRELNIDLLKRLTPAQKKRYGLHSERGKESVEYYTRMIAGHDLNHLGQIERIRRSFKK